MSPSTPSYPNLPNAPIEEAIISITIGKSKYASLAEVESACAELLEIYPQKKPWHMQQAAFHFDVATNKMDTSHVQVEHGFILASEDNKKILHVRQDLISLNRLRPYGSWKKFFDEYTHAWNIYTAPLKIQEIANLSIRYINSFTVPLNEWENYLLMRPVIQSTSEYDQSIMSSTESFARFVLTSERHMAQAAVLLTLRPEGQNLRVIMDIEAFSLKSIMDYPGYHAIIDALSRLRDFKNQIFFSNLPKAAEQFA